MPRGDLAPSRNAPRSEPSARSGFCGTSTTPIVFAQGRPPFQEQQRQKQLPQLQQQAVLAEGGEDEDNSNVPPAGTGRPAAVSPGRLQTTPVERHGPGLRGDAELHARDDAGRLVHGISPHTVGTTGRASAFRRLQRGPPRRSPRTATATATATPLLRTEGSCRDKDVRLGSCCSTDGRQLQRTCPRAGTSRVSCIGPR